MFFQINTMMVPSAQYPKKYNSTSFHYLKIYFTYLYNFGISPFKIVENKSGEFILHTNKIQKVICAFIHIVILLYNINGLILNWPKHAILKSPWLFFTLMSTLIETCNFPTYYFVLWRRKQACFKVFQLCNCNYQFQSGSDGSGNHGIYHDLLKKTTWTKKKAAMTHAAIISLLVVSFCFVANLKYRKIFCKPANDFYNHWITTAINNYGKPIIDFGFGFYSIFILGTFKMLPVACAFIFRHICYEFEEVLKAEESNDQLILDRYFLTKKIVKYLNHMTSSATFVVMISGILYYSLSLILFADSDHSLQNMTGFFGLVGHSMFVAVSVSSTARLNKIKKWIIYHEFPKKNNRTAALFKKMPSSQHINYSLLYQQIVDEPIGINCGSFVTITYKSIANGLGLWATYIIVTLQLYSSKSEIEPPSHIPVILPSLQYELFEW